MYDKKYPKKTTPISGGEKSAKTTEEKKMTEMCVKKEKPSTITLTTYTHFHVKRCKYGESLVAAFHILTWSHRRMAKTLPPIRYSVGHGHMAQTYTVLVFLFSSWCFWTFWLVLTHNPITFELLTNCKIIPKKILKLPIDRTRPLCRAVHKSIFSFARGRTFTLSVFGYKTSLCMTESFVRSLFCLQDFRWRLSCQRKWNGFLTTCIHQLNNKHKSCFFVVSLSFAQTFGGWW